MLESDTGEDVPAEESVAEAGLAGKSAVSEEVGVTVGSAAVGLSAAESPAGCVGGGGCVVLVSIVGGWSSLAVRLWELEKGRKSHRGCLVCGHGVPTLL